MQQSLAKSIAQFTDEHDEAQLRQLSEKISGIKSSGCGEKEIRSLLGVFERFPEADGYGIF